MIRNEREKPMNNDADISRYRHAISKLHIFFRLVMPVCKVVTHLKFDYRREM